MGAVVVSKLNIKKYIFEPINSVMYVLISETKALVIDPNISRDAEIYLKKHSVDDVLILLTHEHCDHISGVNWFRKQFNTTVLCSKRCAENIANSHRNFSEYFNILIEGRDTDFTMDPFTCTADEVFETDLEFNWNEHKIYLKEAPGHSKGSSIIILDNKYLFSGDYLIPDNRVFTKIPGGSKKDYEEKTCPYLESIKDKMIVMSGHI